MSLLRNLIISLRYNSTKSQPRIIKLNERTTPSQKKTKINFKISSLGLLVVPATAFSLGIWQVQRLEWKKTLIAHLKERLNADAVTFPVSNLAGVSDLEYKRVKIRGRFLYDREFVIAPRGRFDPGHKEEHGSLLGNSQSSSHGGHFITPFLIEGTEGWLPTSEFERERARPKTNNVEQIEAIVRKSEKRPQFVSQNRPAENVWFYKNFEEMGQACGSLPILVDAVYDPNQKEGPIGGQTNVNIRNDHLNYLITWFTLSGVTLAMWCSKFLRRV